jgi:hypothetical protein
MIETIIVFIILWIWIIYEMINAPLKNTNERNTTND